MPCSLEVCSEPQNSTMRGSRKLQSHLQVHSEMLQLQRALTQMEQQLATRDRQYADLQRALDLIQRAMMENDERHRATEAENARLQARPPPLQCTHHC
jgi:chromosome segregation ATPase